MQPLYLHGTLVLYRSRSGTDVAVAFRCEVDVEKNLKL